MARGAPRRMGRSGGLPHPSGCGMYQSPRVAAKQGASAPASRRRGQMTEVGARGGGWSPPVPRAHAPGPRPARPLTLSAARPLVDAGHSARETATGGRIGLLDTTRDGADARYRGAVTAAHRGIWMESGPSDRNGPLAGASPAPVTPPHSCRRSLKHRHTAAPARTPPRSQMGRPSRRRPRSARAHQPPRPQRPRPALARLSAPRPEALPAPAPGVARQGKPKMRTPHKHPLSARIRRIMRADDDVGKIRCAARGRPRPRQPLCAPPRPDPPRRPRAPPPQNPFPDTPATAPRASPPIGAASGRSSRDPPVPREPAPPATPGRPARPRFPAGDSNSSGRRGREALHLPGGPPP